MVPLFMVSTCTLTTIMTYDDVVLLTDLLSLSRSYLLYSSDLPTLFGLPSCRSTLLVHTFAFVPSSDRNHSLLEGRVVVSFTGHTVHHLSSVRLPIYLVCPLVVLLASSLCIIMMFTVRLSILHNLIRSSPAQMLCTGLQTPET